MARSFVLSARVTADASGLKAGAEQGARSARGLGDALDDVADKARRADEALQDAANSAARGVPAPAAPSAPSSPSPRSPARPAPSAPAPSAPASGSPNLPAPRPTRPSPTPTAPAPSAPGQLQDWQRTNLRSQYFDIGTSLYGGMNPLTVLSQQGPQIVEIYGGVGNALRGTAAAIGGIGAAVAGVTAVLASGAAAWSRYNSAREDAARSLTGVGRGSGLTLDQLLQQQGAGLSRMESMQAASGLASSGRIGGGQISELMGITRQFMRATGQDAAPAGADLGKAFADPTKGAELLNERFGFLNATSLDLIRTLSGTGQTAAAQGVLFRLLAKDLEDVENRSSGLNRTWQALSRGASNFFTGLGRRIDNTLFGKSNADQLREAEERLAQAQARQRINPRDINNNNQIALLQKEIAEKRALVTEEEKLAKKRAEIQEENRNSQVRTANIRSILPDYEERARLVQIQTSALEVMSGRSSAVSQEEARKAYEQSTYALKSRIDADERARQSDELSARSIMARTAAQRADIAAQRELLALKGSQVSADEALRRSEEARRQVLLQEQRSAEDRLRDARQSAQLVGLSEFERGRREIEQRWARTISESQGSPTAQATNRQAMAEELRAFERAQQIEPLKQAKNGLLEQVAALERLQQTFGMTAGAAAEFAARQQLLNEYQRQGIPITATLRSEIDRYAAGQGRAAQANEDLRRAQEQVVGAMDDVRAGARGAFSGLISNLRQGKSLSESFANSATQALDRIFERMVTAPLVEGLLGANGKPGGGLFGDSVAKLLGGGQALSTANITAATVIVNGNALGAAGIPGLGGASGLAANSNNPASASALAMISSRYVGRPGGVEGLNGDFASRLAPFLSANPGVSVVSGFRSIEAQKALWEQALQRYGSPEAARKWVAPPGSSEHNFGMAADLRFASDAARAQAHATAGQYGLNFRMANEPWHISPNANWQGAPAPANALAFQQVNQFDASLRRATEATDGLQGGFMDVSKTLSQGAGSLNQAASGVTAGASQFTAGANGVFSTLLGGIGQIGNSFVSGLGTALQTILQAISSQGGGGFGGLFSSIFGGGAPGAPLQLASAVPTFARGGVTNRPSIFGEAGPEAAVPLPDGRTIPVSLRITGGRAGNDNAPMMLPLAALTGAVAKLNERVASGNGSSGGSFAPSVVIEDRVGVKMREREEDAPGGGRRRRIVIDEAVADAVGRPNSRAGAAFDARGRMTRR
jgi:phage-related minor tail protein